MRSIRQSREPLHFRKWKKDNQASPQLLSYPPPSTILASIKLALYSEQHGLCAYTLCALSAPADGHIEHIEPRSHHPKKSLDYSNLALCIPANGGDTSIGFGAPIKGGRDVLLNENFISPHSRGCDKRFIYKSNGSVEAVPNDPAAQATIELLKLNCEKLKELRLASITAHGLTFRSGRVARRKARPISNAEATRLTNEILQPDSEGRLQAFCIAIYQVALQYAKDEAERSRRIAAGLKKR